MFKIEQVQRYWKSGVQDAIVHLHNKTKFSIFQARLSNYDDQEDHILIRHFSDKL